MKLKFSILRLLLTIIGFLSGCVSNQIQTPAQQSLIITPSVSPPTEIFTSTATSVPTLYPENTEKFIEEQFMKGSDCAAPCFWGIIPNKTSLDEAETIFSHLGLQITEDNTVHYSVNELSGLITLDVKNELVKSINVSISIGNNLEETSRKWLAYSPETLISRYGYPSKVEVVGSYVTDNMVFAESPKWYSMYMYYEGQGLIVAYEDGKFEAIDSPYVTCPLIDKFEYVKLWFGESPKNPPPISYSLEETSNTSLQEFSRLMETNPISACLILDEIIFN